MREDHPTVPGETRASSKGRAFSSIQGRLVSLLLLVLVPILVAQAYFSYDRYQSRRRVESVANLELARATAKAFDTFVQDVLHQELAIGLAFTSSQTLSEKEKSRILFENQAGNPAIWHFFWDNPAGIVMAATGSQFIGMDISDREFYREIVAGKDWVVSDLLLSKITRQPSFTISRGIRNERGELLGIIVAGILPAKLDRVLAVERPGDAGVSLLDSKGMLVYRYPATQYTWEQRNWLKFYPVLEEVVKGKEIVANVVAERTGINRMAAFAPVPSIGWIASCSRAEEETVGPIISATLQETGLILLVALVSLLTAFALSRSISSSVIILRNHALSLGRGETENPLAISRPAEIKDLAEAFNKMAEEMRFREKALRESERREQERGAELAMVLDAAPVPIFIAHDPECLYLSGNRAADELLLNPRGAEASLSAPANVRPQHFKAFKDGRELRTDELPAQRAASGVPVRDFEFNLVFEDGTTRQVIGYGMPLRDDKGRPRGAVHVLVDITERKKAEEALQRAHGELEKRVAERTAELAWKNRELEDFASVAAHDLQEPLRKIQIFANLLEQDLMQVMPDSARDYLSRMDGAAARMQDLIKALLLYSRVSTKASPFERLDLKQIAEKVVKDLDVALDPRQPLVEIGDLPEIEGDPIQISQLLQNLIGNATRYAKSSETPLVKVSGREVRPAKDGNTYCELRVEDNGIGFEMQYLDKIFRPFERLHGRGEYEGTGMGLAICKKIAERHRGEITAQSRPGEGSTFIVHLPMRQTGEQRQATDQLPYRPDGGG